MSVRTAMLNFIKYLFAPSVSQAEAQRRYAEHRAECDVMTLELEEHMHEVYARLQARKREDDKKQFRIEAMFRKQELGLVSDEEFQAFLLEED
jgi:hypothetical protein